MSKNTVSLTHSSINGSDLFLSGGGASQTTYAGSGTPWTAESTSPYEMSRNDETGNDWVPTPPEPTVYFLGGPPFSLAAMVAGESYPPVTQDTIGVQMKATTKDNAFALLQQLRDAVAAGAGPIQSNRCILSITGGTNIAYWYILGGKVQETGSYIDTASDSSSVTLRATITWYRTSFGARLTPETNLSSSSMANAGTGSPDNIVAFAAAAGDMTQEGSPCNYTVRTSNAGGGDPVRRVIIASVVTTSYKALSSSNTWSTSGTTYATGGTIAVWADALSMSQLYGNTRLRFRLCGIVASGYTGNPEYRWAVFNAGGLSQGVIYSGVIPETNADGYNVRFVDSGPIPVTIQELRNLSDMNWSVSLQIRSSDGGATTGTLSSVEAIFYYDWSDTKFLGSDFGTGAGTNWDMNLSAFSERSGSPCLPLPFPQATLTDPGTSNRVREMGEVRGTVPQLYEGASVYVRLLDAGGGLVYATTTRTFTLTVTHSPLYKTLRAGG